jgi:hypothetical protein
MMELMWISEGVFDFSKMHVRSMLLQPLMSRKQKGEGGADGRLQD